MTTKPRRIIGDDMARFRSKVERIGDCDVWRGTVAGRNRHPAPLFFAAGRIVMAAHWLHEQTAGPVPAGMVMVRLCGQRLCVRLGDGHCTPLTRAEAVRLGSSPAAAHAAKDRCAHGHPFSPQNTRRDKSGARVCRQCRREYPSAGRKYGKRARGR